MPLPADYLPVCEGWYISQEAMERIREVGPESKWHDAALIESVVESPQRVFSGLNRQGFDDGTCHVGVPPYRHDNGGNKKNTAGDRRVFMVYSTLKNYGNVVFDWEWRPGHPETGYPDNWTQDFDKELKNGDDGSDGPDAG